MALCLALAGLLAGCATMELPAPEVEALEKVLRGKSIRFFVGQNLRLQEVGTRLLRALPEPDGAGPRPASLGVVAAEATEELADAFGVPYQEGVLLLGVVPGGPAARAGLRAGDYLETIGARTVTSLEDLAPTAGGELSGPTPVQVRRGGAAVEATVALDQLPLAIEFQVVEDDAVDAVASPGRIAVTAGMLRFLRSDDELAVVVGHELAHVTRNHTIGRLALNVPSVVFGVLAAVIAPGSQRLVSNFMERVVSNLAGVALTKVERDMEREADVFGLLYAHGAGYDPRAAEAVWERFSVELPRSMKTSLLAVHPPSSERLLRIRRLTEALLAGVPPAVILEQAMAPRETPAPPEPAPPEH